MFNIITLIYQMNYFRIKKQLNKTPIVPMQQESFDNILIKVQDVDQDTHSMNLVKDEFFIETKEMYFNAMQRTIVENTIVTPNVKGLENEPSGSPPKELEYLI